MRISKHNQHVSVAALLLTVLAFALCPPDAFCRTHNSSRTRSTRRVRLEDHDHEHESDLISHLSHSNDAGAVALISSGFVLPAPQFTAESVYTSGFSSVLSCATPTVRGRAPPSAA